MRRLSLAPAFAGLLLLGLTAACGRASAGGSPADPETRPGGSLVVAAAEGRLEGRTPAAEVGVEIEGTVSRVLVEEGDAVEVGQALARLRCPDSRARIEGSTARLAAAEARLRRLLRGARVEERNEASAARTAADERLARARRYARRQRQLWTAGGDVISRDALDRAEARERVALAEARSASWKEAAVLAPPLPEEESLARAEVAAARAEVAAERARDGRCTVVSPISGTVLVRGVEPGAAVSPLSAEALFEVADLATWHARVEVDEADLGRVRRGQRVLVTADAFGGRDVPGEVVRLGRRMGRREVHSGDPAARLDRDVLEVVARLAEGPPAGTVGLRVIVRFLDDAD